MHKTLRCTICNCTNNLQVETNPGEFLGGRGRVFLPDPLVKNSFLCYRCKKEIDDMMYDYLVMDLMKEEDFIESESSKEIDTEGQGDDLFDFDTDVPDDP